MTVTVVGFDFGLKHIGIAVGQSVTRTATPVGVVRARDGRPDWDALEAILLQWRPDVLVVGLPLNMDGSASEMSERAEKFAARLRQRYRLPVEMADERLTSFEARIGGDDPADSHAVAARLIAESWLAQTNRQRR
jgi:putative holliday junction resolvase